ncbi:MAG: hypothetical protein U9N59_00265, partial [Campylobacterota bacterium]|nr:hypothetical protein [Campylobacterota bacterium]
IIKDMNKATKKNLKIVDETNIVAQQSAKIATNIVEDATSKKFDCKDDIKIRKKVIDPDFEGVCRREKIN